MLSKALLLALCAALLAALVAGQALNPAVSYAKNGDDWVGLCYEGKAQSPIDMYEGTSKKVSINEVDGRNFSVQTHYHRVATDTCGQHNVTYLNNGYDIEISDDLGYVEFGDNCDVCGTNRYDVKRIVFRSPSEHTIDGKNLDMEMQIVHQKAGSTGNKDILMVSVLFQQKTTPGGNPFLESIEWPQIPANSGAQHIIKGCVDLNRISYSLEDDYFAYKGSLTTPPCDENVPWLVMSKFQGISTTQLAAISHIFKDNNNFAGGHGDNRKVQKLNGRDVFYVVRHPPTTKQILYDLNAPVSGSN